MAVNVVFVHEKGNTQLLVYYINHFTVLAKTKYSSIEKLAFALLVTSQNLKLYFQAHMIVVLTNHPWNKCSIAQKLWANLWSGR